MTRLRLRVELAPGFGRAWLSCLTVCCWLRGVPLYGISVGPCTRSVCHDHE